MPVFLSGVFLWRAAPCLGKDVQFCRTRWYNENIGSLSNVGVSSNSSTTHGRERFLLMSVFILISPSKAVKSENGIVQSCENQMLLSLTP